MRLPGWVLQIVLLDTLADHLWMTIVYLEVDSFIYGISDDFDVDLTVNSLQKF